MVLLIPKRKKIDKILSLGCFFLSSLQDHNLHVTVKQENIDLCEGFITLN